MQNELDIFQMYLKEISSIKACDEKENEILASLVMKGDDQAKRRLVEGNLKFVLNISRDYIGRGVPAGDLVQEANIALILAADEYAGTGNGRTFESFLEERVHGALKEEMERQKAEIQAGKRILERVNMLQDVSKLMAEELGREATVPELAQRLQMTEEDVKEIMKVALDALHALGE